MNFKTLITSVILAFVAGPLFAQNLTYTDPLSLSTVITDKDQVFEKGISRNGWIYSKTSNELYAATLDHKGYKVKAEFTLIGDKAFLKLVDASCDCRKLDQDNVDGWMTKLRRSVAYEITLKMRDDAMRQKLAL